MKKKFLFFNILLLLLILCGCDITTPPVKTIDVPTDLNVENNILTWKLQEDIKHYEVEMTIMNDVPTFQVADCFDFTVYLTPDVEELTFRVKGLKLETDYENDSEYSEPYTY